MKKILLTALLLTTTQHLAIADTEQSIRLDASLNYDDNLNFSPTEANAIESAFATINAGYRYNQRLNNISFIDYNLQTKYESYQDTNGLDNAEVSAGISYHFKPYAGFAKATYILKADIRVADYATDIRDRTAYEASAAMSFWVTNRFSLNTGLATRMRDSDSRVFDTTDYRLFINADLILNQNSTLYSTLNLLTGDLVSTVPLNNEAELLDTIRQASEIEFDPTFGDNMVAYTVDADIVALTLGYNYILGRKQSLDLSARYAQGKADYGINYNALFINISYLVSFKL